MQELDRDVLESVLSSTSDVTTAPTPAPVGGQGDLEASPLGAAPKPQFVERALEQSPVSGATKAFEPWAGQRRNAILDAVLEEDNRARRARALTNMRTLVTSDPVRAENIRKLAKASGLQAEWLEDPETFKTVSEQQLFEASRSIIEKAPLLEALVANDYWLAREMSDSFGNIAEIENLLNKPKGYTAAEHVRGAAGKFAGRAVGYTGRVLQGAGELYDISARALASPILAAARVFGIEETVRDAITAGPSWLSPSGVFLRAPGQTIEGLGQAAEKVLLGDLEYEGFAADVAAAAGEFVAQLVFGRFAGPTATRASLVSVGADIMSDKIAEDPVNQARKDLAVLAGAPVSLIEMPIIDRALNLIVKPAAGALWRKGVEIGAISALETAQEVYENTIMDGVRMLLTNPEAGTDLGESLREGAAAGTATAGTLTAIEVFKALITSALKGRDNARYNETKRQVDDLLKAIEEAEKAPAMQRSGESFAQTLNAVAPDAEVYIDPERLGEALDAAGVPRDVFPELDENPNESAEGVGPGVRIAAGDFIARVAGNESLQAALKDHIRMSAGELSLAELRAGIEDAAGMVEAQATALLEGETARQQFNESADRVRDGFKAALESTGKYQPQQVESFSRLLRAYYATMASRLGITPEQLRDGWVDSNGVRHRGYNPSFVAPDAPARGGVAFNQQATPELFTRANIGRIMEARDWVVMTAENPNAQALSPEENAARNEQFKADLDAMGIQYIEGAVGRYGNLENPLILLGVSPAQAQQLAQKYEQESALFPGGLIYQDGTVNPARGVNVFDTAPEDYYTTLPDGTMFSMDIDFDTRIPLAETEYMQRLEGLAGDAPQQRTTEELEARRIEREFDAWIDADPEAAVDAYLREFGNEINTDHAREFSPAYKQNPSRWSVAVHEPASRLAKLAYARVLETLPKGSLIVFSGGGGGSGKGYSLARTGIKAQADAVYDLTMANYDSTKAKIEQALAAGMKVRIAFVRTPFETAITRAIQRTKTEGGRVVAIPAFAVAHTNAPVTFNALQTDYAGNENVEFSLIDNADTPTLVETATLESPDYNQIVERFQNEIERQLEAGEISREVAAAYLAGSNDQVLGGQSERDAGGVRSLRGQGDREAGQTLGQSVSTRVWSQKAGRPDPHMLTGLDVDYGLVKDRPDFQRKLAASMKGLAQLRITARKPEAILEQAIDQMQSNLRWLFNQVPPEVRARSRKWYEGGRVIVDRWTAKYDGKYTDAQLAGVLAVMSPQLAWDANVTLAERVVDIYTDQQNTAWSPEMEAKAAAILASGTSKQLHEAIRGKKLSELTDPLEAAVWIRVYDETYNPRPYRQVTPEGGWGDWMRTVKGAETKAGWLNGHGPVANAVAILRDGSIPNISRTLGAEHKVRNFYNNLFDPTDGSSVTIDTHAVAAALLSPLSGSSPEVLANFGSPSDAPTGMSGTYVVYAEAYRRLAAEVGMLPREVQSITWEAVRRMYSAPFKSQFVKQPALQKKFSAVWKAYTSGKESIDETRKQLVALTGQSRIPDPGWVGQGTGLDAGAPDSSYTGSVLESGWPEGAADTRSGGAAPAADQAFGQSVDRLTRPPVNDDGTVTLWHYGRVPNISELDPAMSGTGIAGQDIKRREADPDNWVNRTYYGIAIGQPGGYRKEPGLGTNLYRVEVPFDQLYDIAADPDGLRPTRAELSGWDNLTSVFERRIKEAGYKGYWANSQQLGLTAAVFEKMPARQVSREDAPSGAFGQDRRGEFAPHTMEIRLLADADASTFIHETAHFMLTMMTDLALDPNAPADVRADVEAFLKQIGFEGTVEEWAAKPINEQREAHETFAETFEQYIFTGKAPTKELQPLFRRLADFMKRVYRDLQSFLSGGGRRAKLNPELSRLFDRLLATEAEIEGATRERAYEAFFASAAEAGMTPEQFAEYIALDPEHRAQAEESLCLLMLRDLKGEAADRRAEVKAEVEAELSREPVYRAMLWLRRGKFFENGELVDAPAGLATNKLSIPRLKEMFPNVTDWAKLGYGKYGMLSNDGLDPDLVAPLMGFESGDAMVKALLDAPSLSEAVEARTNEVMFERYNDLASPENMHRAIDEALHNDAGLARLAAEVSALYGRVGARSRLLTAARQYAKAIVDTKTSRTLRPSDFSAAELRAGKAAIEALRRGDRQEALKQKRIELLNHAVAMEAHKASREMDKMIQRMREIARRKDDSSSVKSRDGDMVAAVRALLAAYELGAPQVKKTASEYLARLKEYDPGKAAYLEAELSQAFSDAKDWRTMTVAEVRELHSLVKDLWSDARESRRIEVDGEKVLIEDAAEQIVGVLSKRPAFNKTRGKSEALTEMDKLEIELGGLKGRLNRVLAWTGAMDRSRTGPLRRFLWWAVADPSDNYRAAKAEVNARYTELLKRYAHLFRNENKIDGKEINYTFAGNAELVAALLHTGNESNLRKLLLGGRPGNPWGDLAADGKTLDRTRWDGMIARLTAEGKITKDHWDFVQGVWDILESIKPQAQRAHRALFGRYFNEVTATPVQTPFGEYKGGYFPAVTDPTLVKGDTLRRQLQDENQSFSYAMPDRGFTKSRVEYNRPLLLDMRVVSSHIDKVLVFSHLAKPVSDVRRLLSREDVSSALERTQPGAISNMLLPYLDRIAHQRVETGDEASGSAFDRVVRATRRNTAMMYMFANLTNTLLQFTGAPLAALKVPVGSLMKAQADILLRPKQSYEFIMRSSKFMNERLSNSNALMYDNMKEILVNPSVYEKMQNWSARNAYITQLWADRVISTTVWLGAYNHALENAAAGLTHEQKQRQARQLADAAVRQTQMDQSPEGIAAFEAGTPFQRLFTQFIGYFNMWATTTAEELQVARGERNWARMSFVAFLSLAIVPALGEVIRLALAGGPEDEDDDGYLDDWLRTIGWGMLKFYSAAVPYAGPVLVGAIGGATQTDDPFAGKVLASPVSGAVESALRTTRYVSKVIEGEDEVKPGQIIKSTASALTLMTGLPFYAPARGLAYAADVEAGEIDPTSRADYIRGILTGIASPESK